MKKLTLSLLIFSFIPLMAMDKADQEFAMDNAMLRAIEECNVQLAQETLLNVSLISAERYVGYGFLMVHSHRKLDQRERLLRYEDPDEPRISVKGERSQIQRQRGDLAVIRRLIDDKAPLSRKK